MPTASLRRPAGIAFVDQPPDLPEKLPRMDIAVFVGFASAGPLHRPVVLEDVTAFAALFGPDLPLAWSPELAGQEYAHLGASVRAFFRNGGRRCWVIRVAGSPESAFFPLPGLVQLTGAALQPAFATARAPGSWFDAWRTATALMTRSCGWIGRTDAGLELQDAADDPLQSGDLLRLTYASGRRAVYLLVNSTSPAAASPPGDPTPSTEVVFQELGSAIQLASADLPTGPLPLRWTRLPGVDDVGTGQVSPVTFPPGDPTDPQVTLAIAAPPPVTGKAFSPPAGSLIQLGELNGNPLWFQVGETQLAATTDTGRMSQLVGRAFSWQAGPGPAWPATEPLVECLVFELRVEQGGTEAMRLLNLGFAPGHGRYWNAVPDDAGRYAALDSAEGAEADGGAAQAALRQEARDTAFPLAGGPDANALFLPLGMSMLGEPFAAAQNSGQPRLVRDGLVPFSSAAFLDPRLLDSNATTLLTDADFIRYQTPGAPPLTGIHAALAIEEATLIAVPDACHRSWGPTTPPAPPVAQPSAPLAHPTWWHSLGCWPLASPPSGLTGPDYAQFLPCGLRVLRPAPQLALMGPDASDAFQLQWNRLGAGDEYILDEATLPDFTDAVELWRGAATSYSVLWRAPGTYYYRVRAVAGEESSDWSNGVVVSLGEPGPWLTGRVEDFSPDTLLDVQRALLRLCAARGDIVAVLSLPGHFREDATLAYLQELKSARTIGPPATVRPLGAGEERAFSYAAAYHPWLIAPDLVAGLRPVPPDGAACGMIAQRTLARGAWIAPANQALAGVVTVAPPLSATRQLELLLAQLNVIRQEPHGFVTLNADTLSDEEELRPLNVRRLLILLRRTALQLGVRYVFEPNDATLRRTVQGAFDSVLQRLFMRGAFAGSTPQASYRVVTDDSVNPPELADVGQFRIDLQVAPAQPLTFLTIRLVQTGEHAFATEIL